MRIPCPFCGSRDLQEFAYLGDANLARPDPTPTGGSQLFHDYVYLRENPAGPHHEYWYHAAGCRSWLVVHRDTRTHAVLDARLAAGASLAASGGEAAP